MEVRAAPRVSVPAHADMLAAQRSRRSARVALASRSRSAPRPCAGAAAAAPRGRAGRAGV